MARVRKVIIAIGGQNRRTTTKALKEFLQCTETQLEQMGKMEKN
mgnify:CR=1 FL=1